MKRSMHVILWFIVTSGVLSSKPVNLLDNPGFEKKKTGWEAFASCRYEIVSTVSHSGRKALSFYPQTDGAGVGLDVTGLLFPGCRYLFSGFCRNAGQDWGQTDVVLMIYLDSDTLQIPIIDRIDCDKTQWAENSGLFDIPDRKDIQKLVLVLKASWGQNSFYVDDLVLRPALSVRDASGESPALVFLMGPKDNLRAGLKANLSLFDDRSNLISKTEWLLNSPFQPEVPPGYYRLHAGFQDVDGQTFDVEKVFVRGDPAEQSSVLKNQLTEIFRNEALTRYYGWLRYLQFLSNRAGEKSGAGSDPAMNAIFRLKYWVNAIQSAPALLDTLSGVIEWAYFSHVDDSGQPFKLAIPADYDPQKTYPLVVIMHGHGGNHLEYSTGVVSNSEYFELHVLGRARGGGYSELSEADVLDAVQYVQNQWSIDDHRIHLTGASMGGGGTFKMASRFPHLWASGRPVCGYGIDQPILNSRHVPLYGTHSVDDPTVPVLTSRAPLQRLRNAGGQVVLDETNGLQHAAWNYTEGNQRGEAWMRHQVRPDISQIHEIDFTAVDAKTTQAYWLKVGEWGPYPGSARLKAVAGADNHLYIDPENVRAVEILMTISPFMPDQDLMVSVDGAPFLQLEAPLPESVFLIKGEKNWTLQKTGPVFPGNLRKPGSVFNLYGREPLLIVYGTGGDSRFREALAGAAASASRSPNPMWVAGGNRGVDDVPHNELLYGHLKVKADTAVTEADLQGNHLLLIGRASENRVVDAIKNQLPVTCAETIRCSDGFEYAADSVSMGLYYYNPAAPEKRIFWFAADYPEAYHPYNIICRMEQAPAGLDFLIAHENRGVLVKSRHFDSRWQWNNIYADATVLNSETNTLDDVVHRMADAVMKRTGADFVMYSDVPAARPAGVSGVTDWLDIASQNISTGLMMLKMTGAQIQKHQAGFAEQKIPLGFCPQPDSVDSEHIYQVVLPAYYDLVQSLTNLYFDLPGSVEMLDVSLYEVIRDEIF